MSKNTPGPWQTKINISSACVLDGKGALLARLLLGSHGNDRVVANARLMTAAPDLLDALHDCVSVMERELGGLRAIQPELAKARAAIAKAEGSE